MKKEHIFYILAGLGLLYFFTKPSDNSAGLLTPIGSDKPRGIRNNNPLNIRTSASNWKGKIGVDDKGFVIFDTMENGIRAAIKNIKKHYDTGADTLYVLINRWAPPSENDTNQYIDKVTYRTGLAHDFVFPFDRGHVTKIVDAMAEVENGGNYITNQQIKTAWQSV